MCWNCQKPKHFKKDWRNPNKEKNNFANTIIEVVNNALLLAIHITVDDWMLESGALFYTALHKEIMTNYVANDFDKVYLADG